MTVGGRGILTLTHYPKNPTGEDGIKLAYLQCLSDMPPQPVLSQQLVENMTDVGLGRVSASFYEVWDESTWMKLLANFDNVMAMLIAGVADSTIGLRKTIRSPSGTVRTRKYAVAGIVDDDAEQCISIRGIRGPKLLSFTYTTSVVA